MELPRTTRHAFGAALLAALCTLPATGQPSLLKEWPYDVLHLKNGSVWRGLVLEEKDDKLRFQNVRRNPGRPTVLVTATFQKSDILKIDRLQEADRQFLRERIEELDPKGETERRRMEQLDLKAIDWLGRKDAGWRYESDHFRLESNAPEEIVRRAAVRLEQIFAAYARVLPPRREGQEPTAILLFHTHDEYAKEAARLGQTILNPAYFDPARNRILCGIDLRRLGQDLATVKKQHAGMLADLDKQEAELRKLYSRQKADLNRMLEPVRDSRKRVVQTEKRNDSVFDAATSQLFAILYHEAFHAYVGSWAGPAKIEMPRWLNEGLAQVFESSIVEAGELRIGGLDRDKWLKAKELAGEGKLAGLRAVLRSGRDEFIVEHSGQKLKSDGNYLASWALASYLALERRAVDSASLEVYLQALKAGASPEDAFEKWQGEPLDTVERKFHAWLAKVQPDGTVLEIVSGSGR